ncbi:MAG: hypothetical protein JKY65_30250 [Planctomycetes bacterium]|nr:hypothetical protein [Planctomycetota bacterium]
MRTSLWLVLLVGSLAVAQPVPAGTPLSAGTKIESRVGSDQLKGRVGWEIVNGKRELVARLDAPGGAWSGRGERIAPGRYRFLLTRVVPNTRGASGALKGLSVDGTRTETMELLVDKTKGFRAALRKEGKVLSRVEETRPPPPATDPPYLIRRTWWGRYPVAAWGTARSFYDFFKPGSSAFEELRGDVDRAETKALRKALEDFTPKPWGPAEIYRAAREMSLTDHLALQLSFGFSVDERWEMRQMIGIDAKEPLHDKYNHYFASAVMAHRSNAQGSFFVGWLKEVGDIPGTGYSKPDLVADALGAQFGESIVAGRVLDHGRLLPNP